MIDAENCQEIPSASDVFDLSSIPMEVLDRGYVGYDHKNKK